MIAALKRSIPVTGVDEYIERMALQIGSLVNDTGRKVMQEVSSSDSERSRIKDWLR
jgi:hypothetical protein